MMIGIDEAGRGCVIGPLVLSGVAARTQAGLKRLGVKDSKMLSPKQRSSLYQRITTKYDYLVEHITASTLNSLMKKHSLNEIEAMFVGKIIDDLITDGLLNSSERFTVYIDSPDSIANKFKERVVKYVREDLISEIESGRIRLVVEHKADVKYPVASAASIISKVIRDSEIEKIKDEVGFDFGSGYSSDPRTIDFLKSNLTNPKLKPYIRIRWSTVDRLSQPSIFDF